MPAQSCIHLAGRSGTAVGSASQLRSHALPAKTAIALARLIERPTAKDGSSRLASALTKLGPTYVKLGQFLASCEDLLFQCRDQAVGLVDGEVRFHRWFRRPII